MVIMGDDQYTAIAVRKKECLATVVRRGKIRSLHLGGNRLDLLV